ncbi:MAG: molybdate transporter family protein [Alphaproteobacteria bacterium]
MARSTEEREDAALARPRWWSEAGGACGDLGTFVPLVLGAIAIAGIPAAGVLFGFGAMLVASGLFYGLPMAVQPMKAIAALVATGEIDAGAMAASGLVIGAVLTGLALTGMIGRLARLVPWSVTAGLQLGLGLALATIGLRFALAAPWLGATVGLALLALLALRAGVGAPLVLIAATLAAGTALPDGLAPALTLPPIVLPGWDEVWRGLWHATIPQLPLTLTNAVIVTAALTRRLHPGRAGRAHEQNLALTTGLAGLLLAPLGAMPMCHGAGGVQAHWRYGARTGAATIGLGLVLLALSIGFADGTAALLAAIPPAALGAMLVMAGADLAISRRLFDARPSCWPVIGATAAATLLVDPAIGLIAGLATEGARSLALRALTRHVG